MRVYDWAGCACKSIRRIPSQGYELRMKQKQMLELEKQKMGERAWLPIVIDGPSYNTIDNCIDPLLDIRFVYGE